MAEPLQIIHFKNQSSSSSTEPDDCGAGAIRLDSENLEKILARTENRPLCIISVCGPSRQGKSFLLGYIIRCLEGLENDETDWMDWANRDKELTGFKFRNGSKPETQGIWAWSKPFLVKVGPEETPIAILLLDTQGTYDEFIDARTTASIVGLSLLMSSCMVFNFFTKLQEDVLISLDSYIKFGQLALQHQDESSPSKPFQKLTFLIRDWNFPAEFPYGSKGGKSFLESKLQVKPDQSPEAREIRSSLKSCFETLVCYLLPYPGDQALMTDFKGSISELNVQFAKKLEDFISSLINPDDLANTSIKNLFGNMITAQELITLLDSYISIFNSKETPSPISLLEATALVTNQNVLQKCLRKYKESMASRQRAKRYLNAEHLNNADTYARDQATKLFKSSKKLANAEKLELLEDEMDGMIAKHFKEIVKSNDQKREKFINSEIESALKTFKEDFGMEFPFSTDNPSEYFDEHKIVKKAKIIQNDILDDFQEKIGDDQEDDSAITKLCKKVEDKFQEYLEIKVIPENQSRQKTAEKGLRQLMQNIVEQYSDKLKKFLDDNPFVDISMDPGSLQVDHQDLLEGVKHQFTKERTQYAASGKKEPEFPGCGLTEFENTLGGIFVSLTNAHSVKLREHQSATEKLIEQLAEMYTYDMESAFHANVGELNEWNNKNSLTYQSMFDQQCGLPKDSYIYKSNLALFGKKFGEIFQTAILEHEHKEMTAQNQLQTAIDESFNWYHNEMIKCLTKEPLMQKDELCRRHADCVKASQKQFKDFVVPTVNLQNEGMEVLMQKLQEDFDKLSLQQQQSVELAQSTAANLAVDCHDLYQKEMKICMENVRSEETLKNAHAIASKNSVKTFIEKCEGKADSFMEPYIRQLTNENEEAFMEVLEIFELKMGEEDNITAGAISDARTQYNDDMGKRMKNQEFIRPDELAKLHESVSQRVVENISKKTPLTQGQRVDLMQALKEEAFLMWKEQNDMNRECKDAAIGIDLGTTYSCVAVYVGGKTRVIPNSQGKNTTPSYVAFNADGSETVGEPAKNLAYKNPENTIFDAKRIIGRKITDPKLQQDMKYWAFTVEDDSGIPKINVRGKKMHPEQISAKILKELKDTAEKFLQLPVKKAVITVPAYFTDGQRQATKDAGDLAGLEVLMVLTEPVAAAMAYKKQHADTFGGVGALHRNILIFDLGGGTFDVAVLRSERGKLETLAIHGDDHLGGEDFDRILMEYCTVEFQKQTGINLLDGRDSSVRQTRDQVRRRLKRLQGECELRKIELTSAKSVEISVDGMYEQTDLNVIVTRDIFEQLNGDLFGKTLSSVESALREAKIDKSQIHDIVLVGGSTRIPKIQEMLMTYFNGKALDYFINPDEAVAYGAAIKAAMMNGSIPVGTADFTKIQDVTPMSIGVEVYGGDFSIIIPKNTKIPVKAKERYNTAHNNQTSVQVTIYQGEDKIALRNKHLGDFYLNGIPPRNAEVENIDVEMMINAQGILHVNAVCSGGRSGVTVTENKQRMSRAVIQRLLNEGGAA